MSGSVMRFSVKSESGRDSTVTIRNDGKTCPPNTKGTCRACPDETDMVVEWLDEGSVEAPVVAEFSAAEEDVGADVSIGERVAVGFGKIDREIDGGEVKVATGATMKLANATTDLCE